jgi:hypothetical protein
MKLQVTKESAPEGLQLQYIEPTSTGSKDSVSEWRRVLEGSFSSVRESVIYCSLLSRRDF